MGETMSVADQWKNFLQDDLIVFCAERSKRAWCSGNTEGLDRDVLNLHATSESSGKEYKVKQLFHLNLPISFEGKPCS